MKKPATTIHEGDYGTFEIAAGGYEDLRRFDLYTPKSGKTSDGKPHVMEGRWSTGPGDTSPPKVTYPTGYDSRCSWCFLGHAHTELAHERSKQ